MTNKEFLSRLKFIVLKAEKKKGYISDCMINDIIWLIDLYNDSNK